MVLLWTLLAHLLSFKVRCKVRAIAFSFHTSIIIYRYSVHRGTSYKKFCS